MISYTIDLENKKVYVWPELPGEEGAENNYNTFDVLERASVRRRLSPVPERDTAYRIARDELIERGLIKG